MVATNSQGQTHIQFLMKIQWSSGLSWSRRIRTFKLKSCVASLSRLPIWEKIWKSGRWRYLSRNKTIIYMKEHAIHSADLAFKQNDLNVFQFIMEQTNSVCLSGREHGTKLCVSFEMAQCSVSSAMSVPYL